MNLSNELLALIFMCTYMLCAVGFYKLGKVWLQNFLVISYVITLCITGKFFDFFGLTATAGIITYAGLFLATDMLTERYGKKAGFETVRIGFVVSLIFVVMTQATLLFSPVPFAQDLSESMNVVFGSSLRIMTAGFAVYLFAQHFDVWLYHKIHEFCEGRHLWVRNIGSTLSSQLLDTVLFFTLAFWGTMPFNQFLEIMVVGFTLKAAIALIDTPFIYFAKKITPLDCKDTN